MNKPHHLQAERTLGSHRRDRRPTGVSRRQKKKQLGFETLEDRRVMSANALVETLPPVMGPTYITSYSSNTAAGQAAVLQAELDRYAYVAANTPDSQLVPRALPTDELFEKQWYLLNVGQEVGNPTLQQIFGEPGEDINYLGARDLGYTGDGVRVAVLDSGVQRAHPDINLHPTLQFDAITGDGDANPVLPPFNPEVPFTYQPGGAHGTAVAGIIAALDNGEGTVGIAPDSEIVPIRIIDFGQTTQGFIDAFQYAVQNADITNNSWGPADGIRQLAGPSAGELLSLQSSIYGPNAGRNGLGTIHVFAAGNGADIGAPGLDSASYDGYVNSRYTIGVTGVDHDGEYNNVDGTVTSFAEIGPSVLVAAMVGSFSETIGDDTFIGTGVTTTDTLNFTGYNVPPLSNGLEIDGDFLEVDQDAYTTVFGGTSGAAPQVSGVIALMLEANPNLSWRDVQDILVRSARQNAPTATQADGFDKAVGIEYQSTWITNQVPLYHEPDFYDPQILPELLFGNPTLDPRISLFAAPAPNNPNTLGLHAHYAPTPQVVTNGAGYTVSQGRGTNQDAIGYAHGVVDAELAVRLAEQWTSKNQALPPELTFTTTMATPIPAGGFTNAIDPVHLVDAGGFEMIIPGGLGATGPWNDYYDEYFADAPDFDPFDDAVMARGAPLELTPPEIDGHDMIIETIEILVDIGGGTKAALDNLRIVLVSPNGTHSEMNHYFVDPSLPQTDVHQSQLGVFNLETGQSSLQPNGFNAVGDDLDKADPTPDTPGDLVFNFTTNRNWGERSDDAIVYDATTNEPFVTLAGLGGNIFNDFEIGAGSESTVGDLISSGWQLHFENYGVDALTLNSLEIVWHGRPVKSNTERVVGHVGIDIDQSDTFNFSRVLAEPSQSVEDFTDIDGDPGTLRLGEVVNLIDPNPEPFAANVTVFAYRDGNANGVVDGSDFLVDQFVTGHDGNYFFDLEPGDYIITTDSEDTFDDEITPNGFLKNFRQSWQITEDFFKVWDYDANLEVPVTNIDGVDTPSAILDGNNEEVVTGIRNLNFLIDPGPEPAPQVEFSGSIFADFDGDGVFNGDDIFVPNVGVFADTNRNGQFDAGETLVETDASGQYQLTVTSDHVAVIDLGVITPVDWEVIAPGPGTSTYFQNGEASTVTLDPESHTYSFFTQPGDELTSVQFVVQPPFASDGSGGTNPSGTIFGTVFNDANSNTVRDSTEPGVANITVYIDANNSDSLEPGEITTVTNVHGAYVFSEVPAGDHLIRLDGLSGPLAQTVPINNNPRAVTVLPSSTTTNVLFGITNSAILDFGDLPPAYGLTLLSEDGARSSSTGVYRLGARIDQETDGIPSIGAIGDDITLDDDEDGVIVEPLIIGAQAPDAQGQVTMTASRFGGFLHGWIDFNGDLDFDDPGEQLLLSSPGKAPTTSYGAEFGDNVLTFDLPDFIPDPTTTAAGGIYARFRYGSFGIGLTGLDQIGEVEDYLLTALDAPPAGPLVVSPDINQDGSTNGADFLAWQTGAGMTSGAVLADGDVNLDGAVDSTDRELWQEAYSPTPQNPANFVNNTGDIDGDNDIDGADFLSLQRGFGTTEIASLSDGDGNHDGNVNLSDVQLWAAAYGFDLGGPSVAASQGGGSSQLAAATAGNGSALGPRASQPGFREDLEAVTVDTIQMSSPAVNRDLASLASEMDRLEARNRHGRSPLARLEKRLERSERDVDVSDLHDRRVSRDRAMDRLFARRAKNLEDVRSEHAGDGDTADALEVAFGEQIDWRLR